MAESKPRQPSAQSSEFLFVIETGIRDGHEVSDRQAFHKQWRSGHSEIFSIPVPHLSGSSTMSPFVPYSIPSGCVADQTTIAVSSRFVYCRSVQSFSGTRSGCPALYHV